MAEHACSLCALAVGLMDILSILTVIQHRLTNQKAKRIFIVIFYIKNGVNVFSCSGKCIGV
jgi:hypothetical protein